MRECKSMLFEYGRPPATLKFRNWFCYQRAGHEGMCVTLKRDGTVHRRWVGEAGKVTYQGDATREELAFALGEAIRMPSNKALERIPCWAALVERAAGG